MGGHGVCQASRNDVFPQPGCLAGRARGMCIAVAAVIADGTAAFCRFVNGLFLEKVNDPLPYSLVLNLVPLCAVFRDHK